MPVQSPNQHTLVNLANLWEVIKSGASGPEQAFADLVTLVDATLESARAGLLWADDTGMQACSPQVYAMLGTKPGKPFDMNRYVDEWVHPEDRERYRAERAASYGSRDVLIQAYRIVRPDGQLVHVRTHGQFFEKDGHLHYRGLMRDATLEQIAGLETAEQLETLTNSLQDEPISLFRVTQDLVFTWTFNWPEVPAELYPIEGKNIYEFLPPHMADGIAAAVTQAIESGEPVNYEGPVQWTTGGEVLFYRARYVPITLPDGQPGVFGKAYNLTQLINQEAQRQLELIGESLKDEPLILYRMDEDLNYVWSFNWPEYLAETVGPLTGRNLFDIIDGPNAEVAAEAMRTAFRTGEPTSFEGYVNLIGLGPVNFRARYVPVTQPDGTRLLFCKSYDLTNLVSEQADKQLAILSEAMRGEPVILYRIDENLDYTWAFNWPAELEAQIGPLVGMNLRELVPGEAFDGLERAVRHTLATGEPTDWEGTVALGGVASGNYRARYTRVAMPDGSYQLFGKAYNLTGLATEQADKQLLMVAEALTDEPIVLFRMNRDLAYTWRFNSGTGTGSNIPGLIYRHLGDSIIGPGYESLAVVIRQVIDTGKPQAWEGEVEYKSGGQARFRDRIIPITNPDGSREALVKAYNLTVLVNEQADKQLALISQALEDEPLFFYRISRDLRFTWQYNFPSVLEAGLGGPLVGKRLQDLVVGPTTPKVAAAIEEAFVTSKPTSYEGPVEGKGIGTFNFRVRFVPIQLPDGTTEVFAKNYNLTALVNEQADKQLGLLTEALQDEFITIYRMNRNLEFTLKLTWGGGILERYNPDDIQRIGDIISGPGTDSFAEAIRETIDTKQARTWEGTVDFITGGQAHFKDRMVPVEMPDGTTEVLVKAYNITELISQEANKQLNLVGEALTDEPLVLYRINRNLNWTWWFNWGGGVLDNFQPAVLPHFYDMVQGRAADELAEAIRHAIDTNVATGWEDIIQFKDGTHAHFRNRIVPVAMPDGTREALVKAYNLTELVSSQAQEQLSLLTYALNDEPISFARLDDKLNYVWVYNGEETNETPLTSDNRAIGKNFYKITQGPTSKKIGALMEEALRTGQPTEYEGYTHIIGQKPFRIRGRYLPITQPDGSRQIFAKIYNLTELVSQEADKQLNLLADAMRDEPISFSRVDESLHYTWIFNPKDPNLDPLGSPVRGTGKHIYDVAQGEGIREVGRAITETFRTGKPTAFEGVLDMIGIGPMKTRSRFVRVTMPDGSYQVFAKTYNLSELVSQEGDKQLALLAEALKDEPILLARADADLRWNWVFNPSTVAADEEVRNRPIGKTVYDFFDAESAARIAPLMREAIATNQPTSFEGLVFLKAGGSMHYRARYVPITTASGERNLLIKGYNFSNLAEAQSELVSSEARFRVALEHEPLSLSVQNRWGEFLWEHNPHPLFPSRPDKRFYQNMPRAQMAKLLKIKRQVIDSGQPYTQDMWLDTLDKEKAAFVRMVYHPYRLPDGTMGVIGKKYDLTQYRLAEERERDTSMRLAEERKELKQTLAQLKKAHAEKVAELEEARQTQLSLLPTGSPPRIDYAIHYATCIEVGGDYYDFFERAPEEGDGLLLAVGDATGHGLRSAMMVSVVKGYLQLLAHTLPPARLLQRIDKAIKTLGLRRLYMGLLLLERRPGGYAFASAGMPAVMVFRKATGTVAYYMQPRIFLGTELPFPPEEEGFIPMQPGDVLVALSDGLIEAADAEGTQLGLEPIEAAIAQTAPQGCQAVVDALVQLQAAWQGTRPLRDDTTIMAVGH